MRIHCLYLFFVLEKSVEMFSSDTGDKIDYYSLV